MKKKKNLLSGILKRFDCYLRRIKNSIKTNIPNGVIYRVIDIEPETLTVVIRSPNSSFRLKDTIPRIIEDKEILAGLEPIEACWLGYYYGQAIQKKTKTEIRSLSSKVSFLIRNKKGRYRIHSLNRNTTMSYLDTASNLTYIDNPIDIAKNEILINQFDPSQACYIGFLSGLQLKNPLSEANVIKPKLRLIK